MVISFNQLRKIEQNTILLPELNLTVQKKDIVAVQCENEYIGHLFDLLNHPNQIKKESNYLTRRRISKCVSVSADRRLI